MMSLYSPCPLPHPLQAVRIGQGCLGPAVDLDGAGPSPEQVIKERIAAVAAVAAVEADITHVAALLPSQLAWAVFG